jgi:hypothetical protein
MCKLFPFGFANGKLRGTTIHADRNCGENPNGRDIETFHSRKMNVDLCGKLALIG